MKISESNGNPGGAARRTPPRPVARLAAAVLLLGASRLAAAVTNGVPPAAAAELPPLVRPVTLRDAAGNAENDLIDPFRRRGGDADGTAPEPDGDGLMRTTMGEISSEFRILAITVPQDTNTPRAALIQFHNADDPILVHEGDLVRVDRLGGKNGRAQASLRRVKRPGAASDLEEQLRKFVFYVNVKHIEPSFIEVYHNKKRPDETIRLNW